MRLVSMSPASCLLVIALLPPSPQMSPTPDRSHTHFMAPGIGSETIPNPLSEHEDTDRPPVFEPELLRELRQELEPGSSLILYGVGSESTTSTLIRTGAEPRHHSIDIGRRQLGRVVDDFRHKILIPRQNWTPLLPWTQQIHRAGRGLYDQLLRPFEIELDSSERLLLVPDGPLHLLPWGALVRNPPTDAPESPEYLVHWKPYSVWSAATLLEDLRRQREPGSNEPLALAAFGTPGFDPLDPHPLGRRSPIARSRRLLPSLPDSRAEIEDIVSRTHGPALSFLDEKATEAAVRAIGPHARILHFTTHSFFEHGRSAALALAAPTAGRSASNNGRLMDHEISSSLRLDADLVVLSSCDSGLGPGLADHETPGLARAFQLAGARSVVASLWPVDDLATSELMPLFYRSLRKNLPKDQALQAAQLALIEKVEAKAPGTCRRRFAHDLPVFWAPFQLYGHWS